MPREEELPPVREMSPIMERFNGTTMTSAMRGSHITTVGEKERGQYVESLLARSLTEGGQATTDLLRLWEGAIEEEGRGKGGSPALARAMYNLVLKDLYEGDAGRVRTLDEWSQTVGTCLLPVVDCLPSSDLRGEGVAPAG